MPTAARAPIARTLLGLPLAPLRLLERTRGRRRRALIALYLVLAAPVALIVYRYGALWGLPDIGDPFDVAAFRAARVAEAIDARPLYERAGSRFTFTKLFRSQMGGIAQLHEALRGGWSKTSPLVKDWVASNRDALEIWRQAAGRPAAYPSHDPDPRTLPGYLARYATYGEYADGGYDPDPRTFPEHVAWLAQLEASRRMSEGRMADSWTLIRANLRAVRHAGSIEPTTARFGMQLYQREYLNKQVASWASDSRVDVPLLRRALADALALDAIPDSDLDGLKAAYLRTLRRLERGEDHSAWDEPRVTWIDSLLSRSARWFHEARRFVRHEPERSRRVARLVFANWLAHVDDPSGSWYGRRFDGPGSSIMLYLNLENPDTPAAPGVPSPKEIAAWYATTIDLPRALPPNLELYYKAALPLRTACQADLILTLASALYAREHGGKKPPTPRALVGPYLKTLPEGHVPSEPIPGR